jgi:hypothetical protein
LDGERLVPPKEASSELLYVLDVLELVPMVPVHLREPAEPPW